MLIRYLPLILIVSAIVLALAPLEAAAQQTLGPGIRTEMTPVDRETHNGVFDHRRKTAAEAGLKPSVSVGEVQTVHELKADDVAARYVTQAHPYTTDPTPPAASGAADREPRPKDEGAPVDTHSENKAIPPGADERLVHPAQAFPPDRIDKTPQAPSRGGVDTQTTPPKNDPRSVEERKDPGG